MYERIGIAGLGLMGGSLAKAIRKGGLAKTLVAADADERTLMQAKDDGIIDAYSKEAEIFRGSEIVFLCLPVQKIKSFLTELSSVIDNDTVVSDMGSTKEDICSTALSLGMAANFVGGHPMCGAEKSGYEAATATLFENAYYILIPTMENSAALAKVKNLIEGVKALPVLLDANEHDRIVAMISHLPHLAAVSLVNAVEKCDNGYLHNLAAGGFKDLTRIASSSPEMWQDICVSNKDNILAGLDKVLFELGRFKERITGGGSTEDLFRAAKAYRDSFESGRKSEIVETYRITLDVEDRPGIIARVAAILAEQDINISNIGINNSREMEEGILEIRFYDKKSCDLSYDCLREQGYRVFK